MLEYYSLSPPINSKDIIRIGEPFVITAVIKLTNLSNENNIDDCSVCFWSNCKDTSKKNIDWHSIDLELTQINKTPSYLLYTFKTIVFIQTLGTFEYTYKITNDKYNNTLWAGQSYENGQIACINNSFNPLFQPFVPEYMDEFSIWFNTLLKYDNSNNKLTIYSSCLIGLFMKIRGFKDEYVKSIIYLSYHSNFINSYANTKRFLLWIVGCPSIANQIHSEVNYEIQICNRKSRGFTETKDNAGGQFLDSYNQDSLISMLYFLTNYKDSKYNSSINSLITDFLDPTNLTILFEIYNDILSISPPNIISKKFVNDVVSVYAFNHDFIISRYLFKMLRTLYSRPPYIISTDGANNNTNNEPYYIADFLIYSLCNILHFFSDCLSRTFDMIFEDRDYLPITNILKVFSNYSQEKSSILNSGKRHKLSGNNNNKSLYVQSDISSSINLYSFSPRYLDESSDKGTKNNSSISPFESSSCINLSKSAPIDSTDCISCANLLTPPPTTSTSYEYNFSQAKSNYCIQGHNHNDYYMNHNTPNNNYGFLNNSNCKSQYNNFLLSPSPDDNNNNNYNSFLTSPYNHMDYRSPSPPHSVIRSQYSSSIQSSPRSGYFDSSSRNSDSITSNISANSSYVFDSIQVSSLKFPSSKDLESSTNRKYGGFKDGTIDTNKIIIYDNKSFIENHFNTNLHLMTKSLLLLYKLLLENNSEYGKILDTLQYMCVYHEQSLTYCLITIGKIYPKHIYMQKQLLPFLELLLDNLYKHGITLKDKDLLTVIRKLLWYSSSGYKEISKVALKIFEKNRTSSFWGVIPDSLKIQVETMVITAISKNLTHWDREIVEESKQLIDQINGRSGHRQGSPTQSLK